MRGAKVRPLAEVRFAEDDGTLFPQLPDEKRIVLSAIVSQRKRTGTGRHAVAGVDVGFEDHRYPVQGTTRPRPAAFPVQGVGDSECVGIYLDDRIELWPGAVQRIYAREVIADEFDRGEVALVHRFLQSGNVVFVQVRAGKGGACSQEKHADKDGNTSQRFVTPAEQAAGSLNGNPHICKRNWRLAIQACENAG